MADFTLRVRPQDEFSSSEVDIGFTTDIIPNRLLLEVEGNFDTGDNPQAITNNNISGDAALTAIINKPGTVRSKLFTRTIDRLYDDRQGMQEHGLGIYYREDFDKFADVIKRRRARSEKKEREKQIKASEGEALKPEEITEEPDRESQERYDYE